MGNAPASGAGDRAIAITNFLEGNQGECFGDGTETSTRGRVRFPE